MARNNTIQDLLDLYQNLIDEFKEVHKRTRMLEKENASEIINDIKEMAVERDIGLYLPTCKIFVRKQVDILTHFYKVNRVCMYACR